MRVVGVIAAKDAGATVGDTVAAATRSGSLDADIRLQSASDLDAVAGDLPRLQAMAFNGGRSAKLRVGSR